MKELGEIPSLYAYPYGEADEKMMQLLSDYKFKVAFGQHSGVINETSNLYYLPRFSINEKYSDINRIQFVNPEEKISFHGQHLLSRRNFLGQAGMAMGALSLTQLLAEDNPMHFGGKAPIRPEIDPKNLYAPRAPHFPSKANQVLVIYLPGAVSHVDTFDY